MIIDRSSLRLLRLDCGQYAVLVGACAWHVHRCLNAL